MHTSIDVDNLFAGVEAEAGTDDAQEEGDCKTEMCPQPPSEPAAVNCRNKDYNFFHIK